MVLKSMGVPAALALALLSMGCGPAADPPTAPQTPATAAAPAPAPAPAPAADDAPLAAFDERRALDMLEARLAADHVYADAQCLQYAAETDAESAADAAAALPVATASAAIEFAVREKHGDGCPGDPQTAPVRDRYRVERSGAILWYDAAEGGFVGYAQRARDSAGGML
ncbi:hypothetical protein FZ025_04145 [Xanthomonas hyacinthi]|uniref:Lipoprotein n=1 Tax=Xanthomonas hyacinthi TaxID=56455 RepID=A0A2S7F2R4_9XANT|nr:hypothetical protein [Xanthomonas hyacinthi]KLD77017.1 hypothetical protein Y886_18035 [Xanthomonas hyacinthi DSM 19077]PPU99744.1 hypothetical protein XhyaCFBP1156_00810 [Xanthomonas hyacinthi]QGY75894.1 hypothetical protein FZ025_04145 [Xanthomonas hyacinthi]